MGTRQVNPATAANLAVYLMSNSLILAVFQLLPQVLTPANVHVMDAVLRRVTFQRSDSWHATRRSRHTSTSSDRHLELRLIQTLSVLFQY
jgi:hypothetical protein